MSDLETAIRIAVEAHAGQVDKAGAPYILHPLRVMLSLSGEAERIAGVLHDVVEDCEGWSLERLRAAGFPEAGDRRNRGRDEARGRELPGILPARGAECHRPGRQDRRSPRQPGPRGQLADDADTRWRIEKYRAALAILEG